MNKNLKWTLLAFALVLGLLLWAGISTPIPPGYRYCDSTYEGC